MVRGRPAGRRSLRCGISRQAWSWRRGSCSAKSWLARNEWGKRDAHDAYEEDSTVQIRRILWLSLLLAAGTAGYSNPALAQFSPSYKFLESVRKQEAQEVTDAVSQPGSTIINTRDSSTGDTALHIVVARRDPAWTGFLLAKGADPNIGNNHGITPLMLASALGFVEAVTMLVDHGARLNDADSTGETPLI